MMLGAQHGHGEASGKIILLGEHAVVYGVTAIAVGIERGAEASARFTDGPASALGLRVESDLVSAPPPLEVSSAGDDPVARAYRALLEAALPGGALSGGRALRVDAVTRLSPGGGLGCSAALGVAIARAVLDLTAGAPFAEDDVAAAARAWERVFHGNPSGIDTATAAHGGALAFSRAAGAKPLVLGCDLLVCVGWSGRSSSTKEMVDALARRRERDVPGFDRSLAAIGTLVDNARLAIEAGDTAALGKLMDLNQMLLAGWMLSTEELESLCRIAREVGALGAKLTGAGGGGSAIALVPSGDVARGVLEAWRAAGFGGFSTRVRARAA